MGDRGGGDARGAVSLLLQKVEKPFCRNPVVPARTGEPVFTI
jgi:hypothetical protein